MVTSASGLQEVDRRTKRFSLRKGLGKELLSAKGLFFKVFLVSPGYKQIMSSIRLRSCGTC